MKYFSKFVNFSHQTKPQISEFFKKSNWQISGPEDELCVCVWAEEGEGEEEKEEERKIPQFFSSTTDGRTLPSLPKTHH